MNVNTQKVNFHTELSIFPDYINDFFAELKINTLIHDHLHRKRSGYPVNYLLLILMTLPFYDMNLFSFCNSNKNKVQDMTVFYSFLNNTHNSWRKLISNMSLNFIDYIDSITKDNNNEIIFAFDSSSIHKNDSISIEFLGRLYDHSEDLYYLGYEITPLLCIYKGVSFALDFIFKSNTKENNILIDTDDIKLKNTSSLERRKECFNSVPNSIINMVDRAISNGISPDYIVADSWYSTKYFIKSFYERKLNYICMLKNDETYFIDTNGGSYSIQELCETLDPTLARPYNKDFDILGWRKVYVEITNEDSIEMMIPVKIVFTALRKDSKKNNDKNSVQWSAILSTNTSLPVQKIVDVYRSRWEIEVFFKETKQILNLNKHYQGRNFDGFISTLSILLIQHYLLLFYTMNNNYKTSNKNFAKLSNDIKYYHYDIYSVKLWKNYFDMVEESYTGGFVEKQAFINALIMLNNVIYAAILEERSYLLNRSYIKNLQLQINEYLYQMYVA